MMLHEDFDSFSKILPGGAQHFQNLCDEEIYIQGNLASSVKLRPYQKEAIGRAIYYLDGELSKGKNKHLLFNMATGSGKTVVMAALILAMYKRGVRRFVFFTRLSHIVEKTRLNFLESNSSKSLFPQLIRLDGKPVKITEVQNFAKSSSDDISILFTTTSGLHTALNDPREGGITFEELSEEPVCLIADEAHNLSANTSKGLGKAEQLDIFSWETTVTKIIQNGHPSSGLLEFTATPRLEEDFPEIREKYQDKAIYNYDLKQFRLDGYSKDVRTLEVDSSSLDRALVAVLTSQYRLKVAEKHLISLKPVVLFKANRVNRTKSSKSSDDEKEVYSLEFKRAFHELIQDLTGQDIKRVLGFGNAPILVRVRDFFESWDLDALAKEIQLAFATENCLTVDDGHLDGKMTLLSTLEENSNRIRAVFATEKLNEGWDVLNLFDIVRLYDTRDSKSNKPGATTVQEAQLIGRGARYWPFAHGEIPMNQRKFDGDLQHELRVIEELTYHSKTNPRYIQELTSALVSTGIAPQSREMRTISLKPDITSGNWGSTPIFTNLRVAIKELPKDQALAKQPNLSDLLRGFEYVIDGFDSRETAPLSGGSSQEFAKSKFRLRGRELSPANRRFGFEVSQFGNFERLQSFFPAVQSIEEFLFDDNYFAGVSLTVVHSVKFDVLPNSDEARLVESALNTLFKKISEAKTDFVGSFSFVPTTVERMFGSPKEILLDPVRDRERLTPSHSLSEESHWFGQNEFWGTSEEKSFVDFIRGHVSRLNQDGFELLLLRNELHFAIYEFAFGRAFHPDFLLLARDKVTSHARLLQLFVEPKGSQFLDADGGFQNSKEGWKQDFLIELESRAEIKLNSEKFRVIGLPFFNATSSEGLLSERFTEAFEAVFRRQP